MKTEEGFDWKAPSPTTAETSGNSLTDEGIEKFTRRLRESEEIRAAKKQKEREKKDLEVRQLVAELEELRKLIPREEIDIEEIKREAEAEYKSIPMYDWGARKESNEHDMVMKYGLKIVDELRRCKWDAEHIPKSLIADMHRIHEGKLPLRWKKNKPATRPVGKLEKAIDSQVKWNEIREKPGRKPKHFKNDQFSSVKAGFFNVARVNKHLQNPTTLLLYLLQHRAWEGKRDKHNTYDTWYRKRRLIVASVGVEKICADLGVHEKTVRNWVNALHKSGVIRKLKDGKENVYVLGEVINNEDLFYYSGEIRGKVKPGSLH